MSYVATPYDNSRSTNTIAELMLRQGQIRAQGLRAQGDASAAIAGSLGDLAVNGTRNVLAAREQARQQQRQQTQDAERTAANAQQRTIGDQTIAQNANTLAQQTTQRTQQEHAKQVEASARNIIQAMNAGQDENVLNIVRQTNPEALPIVQEFIDKQRERTNNYRLEAANRAIAFKGDPTVMRVLVGLDHDPQSMDHFLEATGGGLDPEKNLAYANQIRESITGPEKPIVLNPGDRAIRPSSGFLVGEGNPRPVTPPPNPTEASLAALAAKGDTNAQAALDLIHKNRSTAGEDAGVNLTPAGLEAAAQMYARTGQLPAMGMGKATAGIRSLIINKAAELYPDLDVAGNRADSRADATSLSGLTKQRDAITAFENTAKKNIDLFLEQAGKVVDTGSPIANRIARQVGGDILGSPNVAAFNAARQVAINEIAKIVSNPNLSGTLSDSARKEVEAFNPESATLAQSVAVMRLLRKDMENRTQSLEQQIAAIRGRRTHTPAATDPLGIR